MAFVRFPRIGLGLLLLSGATANAETKPETPPAAQVGDDTLPEISTKGFRYQLTDDPAEPFVDPKPKGDAEKMKSQALTWFMAGEVHSHRRETEKAIECYRKAVDLDPDSVQPYGPLIALLHDGGDAEEAKKFAFQAAERDSRGLRYIWVLAGANLRQPDIAIELLEKGLLLKTIEAGSADFLTMQRDLGSLYRAKEKWPEAAAKYKIVFDVYKDQSKLSAEDRERIFKEPGKMLEGFGEAFLNAKMPDLALEAFDSASKLNQGSRATHSYNLALVFRETGKPEESLKELDQYFGAQLQNKGRAAYQLLADLLKELHRESELMDRLEGLRKKDPQNPGLRFFVAEQYAARKEFAKAEGLYTEGVSEVRDPRALVGLIPVYQGMRNSEKLLDTVSKVYAVVPQTESDEVLNQLEPEMRDMALRLKGYMEALPEDKEAMDGLVALGRKQAEGDDPEIEFLPTYILAKFSAAGKRTPDATFFYELAISMRNDPPGLLYRELAQHLMDVDDYKESIRVLNDALKSDSESLREERWTFQYFLSFAYELSGETDQALQIIRDAQVTNPKNPQLKLQEGWVLSHSERWDEAITVFQKIVAESARDKKTRDTARFSLSNAYAQSGDKAKGEAILEEVLKEDPDNTQANNDLAYLWSEQGKNLEKAKEMVEKALKGEPGNAAYLDSLGWILFQMGKAEEALKPLLEAAEKPRGKDPTIYDHLGDVYDKLGRKDEATAAWKKGLELETKKPKPDKKMVEKLEKKIGK
jgi:tetratricopeptide (TPR) repeat protein